MAFHRITWHEQYKFATLHNYGCTFRCSFCSYKLRSGAEGRPGFAHPKPQRFLSVDEIKKVLLELQPEKVYFMGGEPTVAKELPEILQFAKTELKAMTKLGHTNGSMLPMDNLDGANVGFKAWSDDLHEKITGRPKQLIYNNFANAFKKGMALAANMVYIPGLVAEDEFKGCLEFLSSLSEDIPFHIMGYIPVPGEPYRRPEDEEMESITQLCRKYLKNVAASHLTTAEALDLACRDDRFRVKTVAGE
ncbi:MAG: radical SAM protein [Lentisphaerae bacterium]|nr:radical SAM protein [Lentisphaerota bacterium]